MSTATMEPKRVEIVNVGPINRTFPIELDGPGVYELKGSKGAGKSTIIRCVESLISGHAVDLTVTDGELDGSVKGFGRVVPIGGRKRARGDFEADALDSERFSINDITDPPVKNPAAADAHAIKALASLTRAKADVAAYYDLVGGQAAFEELVAKAKTETEDPVLLASRIKEAFDAAARLQESKRDTETGHAQSCQEAAQGIDLNGPFDASELAGAAERAAARVQELESQRQAAERAHRESEDGKRRLAAAKEGYKGPTVEQARESLDGCRSDLKVANQQCERLRAELRDAESMERIAEANEKSAAKALEAAEQNARLIQQLETHIDRQSAIPNPEPDEIEAARQALESARSAQEQGVRIRDARKSLEKAERHLKAAEDAGNRAEQLRNAARGAFDVLTRSVHLDGLRIESVSGDPRLVVEHPNRKGRKTLFSELSDGERTLTAMRLLTRFLGDNADGRPIVFPVSQRLWQDLPASDRKAIDVEAKRIGCFVFAGLVDDGELRVERYAA